MIQAGEGWRVKKEKETPIQCSLIKSPIVFIEPVPRHKMKLLMSKYPHQEWVGYLVGRSSEKENYFVEDLFIPPHKEVSAGSAEVEPFHIPDRCIGIIHSHGSMGAFHSTTDQDYVDKNYPVSITVSKKSNGDLEFDTISYQTTACGKNVTIKGQVKYVQPKPSFDTEAFMKEAVANIDKGKRAVVIHYPHHSRIQPELGYSGYTDYFIGEDGRAMSQKAIDTHLKEIWGD